VNEEAHWGAVKKNQGGTVGEYMYSFPLSLTSALGGVGG